MILFESYSIYWVKVRVSDIAILIASYIAAIDVII